MRRDGTSVGHAVLCVQCITCIQGTKNRDVGRFEAIKKNTYEKNAKDGAADNGDEKLEPGWNG